MSAAIYTLPPSEAERICDEMRLAPDEARVVIDAVAKANPALVLLHNSRPFVVCGFQPVNIMTNSAYAWMEWTPEIYDHHIAATKLCVEVFSTMRRRYSYIFGHCSFGPRPVQLLKRLGARFSIDPDGNRPCYVIEGYHEPAK